MAKKNRRSILVFSLLLALVLAVAACVPGGQIPTTGQTQPTPAGDEDTEGSTIPQTGDVGQPTPGDTSGIREGGEVDQPVARLTVTEESAIPGGEIVMQGQGFEPGATIRIFAGRPGADGANEPLATTRSGEDGTFSTHLVLPMEFSPDAVTAGQLLLTATAGEGQEIVAMTVVQTGMGAPTGEGTGEPTSEATAEPTGEATQATGEGASAGQQVPGLTALQFDARQAVLPVLVRHLGGEFDQQNVRIVAVEEREWENGCLGLGEDDELCTQQIVPGYLLTVDADGREYHLRTNLDGSQVRMEQGWADSSSP